MTSQEKLILRFLLTMLVIGSAVGVVRRTWFPHSLDAPGDAERTAREMASILRRSSDSRILETTVNLNTASKRELMSLPGIGEALAERIILYREDFGEFGSLEDLTEVRGIGIKTVNGLKERATVDGKGNNGDLND
ncbi:MAG: ComEA family DNA-binding protein [Fidelibacterota bacterium]